MFRKSLFGGVFCTQFVMRGVPSIVVAIVVFAVIAVSSAAAVSFDRCVLGRGRFIVFSLLFRRCWGFGVGVSMYLQRWL